MDFGNPHLEELLIAFHSFYVEAFNIFALGSDQLPHLICACPNRNITLALCALLDSAGEAQNQQAILHLPSEKQVEKHVELPIIAEDLSTPITTKVKE